MAFDDILFKDSVNDYHLNSKIEVKDYGENVLIDLQPDGNTHSSLYICSKDKAKELGQALLDFADKPDTFKVVYTGQDNPDVDMYNGVIYNAIYASEFCREVIIITKANRDGKLANTKTSYFSKIRNQETARQEFDEQPLKAGIGIIPRGRE